MNRLPRAAYDSGGSRGFDPFDTKEGLAMDPHFNEYLAAVAGMSELYGEGCPETGSEFHEETPRADCPEATVVAA
jgi:hypothetical protein